MDGWLSFVISIVWIGILTAVIGDVAAYFGCAVGLKDSVTAITLVALGTSVPGICRTIYFFCLFASAPNFTLQLGGRGRVSCYFDDEKLLSDDSRIKKKMGFCKAISGKWFWYLLVSS